MIDPADADQLARLLRRHRIDLKHGFGQNFLTDPSIRDAIAEAAGITSSDEVLEVHKRLENFEGSFKELMEKPTENPAAEK